MVDVAQALWLVVAIAGLVAITIVTRGLFVVPDRELPLPGWLREALRHAPVGALAAIVAPDVLLRDGRIVTTFQHAPLIGAVAAAAWYAARRDMLGTIVVGTAAMMMARHVVGW